MTALQRGRGRTSGAPIEGEVVLVFTVRRGAIARWQMFRSEQQAREVLITFWGTQGGKTAVSALRRMRRTVLRDSLSARLISRRVRPCALSTRTLLRISVGMMLGMALDVVAKSLEAVLHTSDGVHHGRGQWANSWQSLAHARDDHVDAPKIDLALAFRPVAQTLVEALLITFLTSLDKQMRMDDQTFTGGTARLLVMCEPTAQVTGGQRRGR